MPPRPLRPKDEPSAPDSSDSPEPKVNKRRAISSACIPCRKRKSKCDGALPSCSTCTAVYRTECSYDAESDHRRKGALKRDIQSLQQQNNALDVIVASLRSLPESESITLLHGLRSDSSLDALAASLQSNVKLPHSFGPQTLEADFAQQMSQSPANAKFDSSSMMFSREQSADGSQHERSRGATPSQQPATWFRVAQDAEFVEHLLNLYFCWVHPFYHFFSQDHFLHDMGRGKTEFCSAALVNAVLALACHYSDRPGARGDPNNARTAGDHFFAEAKMLLDKSEKATLTTVQALGVMSVRESSHGRDSSGYQYAGRCVRMALEMGLHLSVVGSGLRASEIEVRKTTFWGVFNLETIFAVAVGRLSQLPRAAADIQRPAISERTENQTWRPYEDTNLALSPTAGQPARSMLFIDQLSKLSELASDMVNTFYAPQERFTSRRLATAYSQYQDWYQKLPDAFRLENTSLPHVIVLHMYYHACVLHLFRPYIKLDLSGANLFPRDTCTFAANEISALMSALRAMYGLRRICLSVTSILLSASTIHLLNLPSESSATNLTQGLRDLQAMSINHEFAARCVDIIRALASKWDIALPEGMAPTRPAGQSQFPSPPSSTFWAASIPRKVSSSGTTSNGSASSNHGSPFPPPRRSHSNFTPFFNDTSASNDLSQTQNAFWTPFPVQTMPVPPQNILPSMSMDFSPPMVSQATQWDMFESPTAGITPGPDAIKHQYTTPTSMDQTMQFGQWQWQ